MVGNDRVDMGEEAQLSLFIKCLSLYCMYIFKFLKIDTELMRKDDHR